MSAYGKHLAAVARSVRTGALDDMRLDTKLTAADLRAGADRLDAEAAFRRRIADRIQDRVVPASWVIQQRKDGA